ncbi:MAG TPA: phosphatidylserine decarboxylase family protein [bacterium]|nr:phosphatidylserine decarboxylase family protein [bacterium]
MSLSGADTDVSQVPVMRGGMGIAREGIPFILIALGLSAVVFILAGPVAGAVSLALPAFVVNFFRDPERTPPPGEDLVVSPADGRVISVAEVDEGRYLNRRMKRICVFMNVFNVHVNRVPISGCVETVRYNPGKFLMGYAEKASLDNEQNAIVIRVASRDTALATAREGSQKSDGRDVLFVQIAGLVARRIVCYLKGGERVTRGERFGLIRFGSRVDVYLPPQAEVRVKTGDKVKAGQSVLGRLT